MKKTILFSLLTLINVFVFCQNKYVTFTDSVIYNPSNYLNTNGVRVYQIPNSNNYVLLTNYSSNQSYYFAQLDQDGYLFSDTVIDLQSYNGYPNINAVNIADTNINIWSTYSYNNFPLMLNLGINGNYNWNTYYKIDTLQFSNKGGIRSSDGGLLFFGNANYWPINYGFILKTDISGTILWSKFYGQKNDLSDVDWTGGVENLIETPDGGFLFSGGVNESLTGNRYPTITKINAIGDFQWTQTLEFLAPINNNMDGGSNIRSILPIDGNNMLIALEINDSNLMTKKMGLIGLNPITGGINWKNSYHLNSGLGNFNFNGLVRKLDGKFVGSYNQDLIGSVLFELDQNGGLVNTIQLREQPITSQNSTIYNGISPTNDGGVLITANLLSNFQGTLLFKTNNFLNTNCPEIEYPAPANLDTLGIVTRLSFDTTFNVTFTPQALTPSTTPASYDQSISDPYCKCDLNIYGSISYSTSFYTADSVLVFLYEISPTGSYVKRDSVLSNADGMYQFSYLPAGDYVVKAVPSVTKYPDYVPTYFGMPNPTTQWDSSFVIHQECGFNSVSNNINLIQKLPQTGTWTCSGYVLQYYGYNAGTNKAAGEPLPDIDISINQSPGGVVSSTTSNPTGHFEFTGLSNSATYIVRADIPGLPNDSVYTFSVNSGDGALDSLNFYVSADSVFILPEYIFTGVNVLMSKVLNVNISPNPTNSNFILEVNTEKNTTISFVLNNSMGQLVYSKSTGVTSGNNKINFEIKDFPQGVYYLSIINEKEYFVKKIIKQ